MITRTSQVFLHLSEGPFLLLPVTVARANMLARASRRKLIRQGLRALTIERPGRPTIYRRLRPKATAAPSRTRIRAPARTRVGYRRAPRRQSAHRATGDPGDSEGDEGDEGNGRSLGKVRLVPVSQLRLHPDAQLVPEMQPSEYAALLQDVRERRVRDPLKVRGEVVLDGRHRLRAAEEAGLLTVPVLDVGEELPEADSTGAEYMLKAALLRRHLADDQRAIMAARWAKAHPSPRGGDRKSVRARAIKLDHGGKVDRTPGRTSAASLFGVTASKVKKAALLLSTAPELSAEVAAGEIKIGQALISLKRQQQLAGIKRSTLPAGIFRVIVADPPWRYDDTNCAGAAEAQYPTMSIEQICAMPIRERAATDAHCYLWVTNPMLAEGLKVLSAWGFEFKTMITWRKPRLGLGRYFRSQTEHILFGTRGKLPLRAQDIPNIFEAPQGHHSEKPEAFCELVRRASPGPYLELFARRVRPEPDWTCWGAEVESPPGIHDSAPQVNPPPLHSSGSAL